MTVSVSHWHGRLGNNIQQCAVGTMAAELLQNSFESIDHEIISNEKEIFGNGSQDLTSKWFYWEGPYQETNIPVDYIYKNMRRICRDHISKRIQVPDYEQISDDTIVIHIRSGDIFDQIHLDGHQYTPNPLHYYLTLIETFSRAIIVTEPDNNNPIVEILRQHEKVTVQSKSVAEDFATLLAAKHIASSGVGTFCVAAALCSKNIENFYCTDLMLTEHLNYSMLVGTDVNVSVMELKDYIKTGEWKNTEDQRKFILEYTA